jgi:hypothetical protein
LAVRSAIWKLRTSIGSRSGSSHSAGTSPSPADPSETSLGCVAGRPALRRRLGGSSDLRKHAKGSIHRLGRGKRPSNIRIQQYEVRAPGSSFRILPTNARTEGRQVILWAKIIWGSATSLGWRHVVRALSRGALMMRNALRSHRGGRP